LSSICFQLLQPNPIYWKTKLLLFPYFQSILNVVFSVKGPFSSRNDWMN
jgi:hypothetical protein